MAKKAKKKTKKHAVAKKSNPPVKSLKKSTGWMDAHRVKILKKRGGDVVLIQKRRAKRKR
jgi:hypothetical protein